MSLFNPTPTPNPNFTWSDMPFFVRDYYNYMLGIVHAKDETSFSDRDFKYYNANNCLALVGFPARSSSGGTATTEVSYCADLVGLKSGKGHVGAKCYPDFKYIRGTVKDSNGKDFDPGYALDSQLSMGSVIWLYYYERMGIFKILGALLDDYNYKGKYTIKLKEGYAVLLEHASALYRMGIASNLRDRVTLYEKTLGLSVDNNYGMTPTRNESFMKTFDGILKQALEHYAYRRLDNAISSASNATRSSVATLTTIKDSLENLKSQFQPFFYGRNAINTFLGIATVYATVCLLRLIKSEIGISNQYTKPQDFIPAAYDILVTGKPPVNTDNNRFITYDNCASYGYRLLTDFELVNTSLFNPTSSLDDPLNLWINNIEPLVEGYKKAVESIKD